MFNYEEEEEILWALQNADYTGRDDKKPLRDKIINSIKRLRACMNVV